MGYGDDLLVTSLAAKIKKQFPERQIVIGIAEKIMPSIPQFMRIIQI